MNGLSRIRGTTQRRAKRVVLLALHEGVEAIITPLTCVAFIALHHGEGMVQTTHLALARAAKAEVVSIILWFWVRIPVGPPVFVPPA